MGQYNTSETIRESGMIQNIMRDVFFSLAEIRAGDGDRPTGGAGSSGYAEGTGA